MERRTRSGIWQALASRRTVAVSLLSFSSGLPLGLVWIAIPDWMRASGVDIRVVGMMTLAQAPWSFKILWSPLMDRFSPGWLGRRRGWMLLTQVALLALTLGLAGVGDHPDAPWVVFALALALAAASASQDIVIDAYAVETLREDEQGVAVGARTAVYRAAMYVAGALAITLTAWVSWSQVCVLLALLYLPMLVVTLWAPSTDSTVRAPTRLVDAIWKPFVGVVRRDRALEILGFVLLYKLADNLAQSLQRPFLNDMGYDAVDRGIALGTIGLAATLLGTFAGGALTRTLGLGHALWIFGVLQILSNVGFIVLSVGDTNRLLMYGAMGFESVTTGLGMGAFGVLLLRLTERRFSATQYALFSSIFGLPRILAGPVTGVIVHSAGWTWFFVMTMAAGVPGLLMLARFVPIGVREPRFDVRPPRDVEPPSSAAAVVRGILVALLTFATVSGLSATLVALEAVRDGGPVLWSRSLRQVLVPHDVGGWTGVVGIALISAIAGLLGAAFAVARSAPANDLDHEDR